MPSFERNPCTQWHEILSRQTRDLVAAYSEDFVILACTVLIQITSVTDGETDRQTPRRWQRRAKHSAFARKKWMFYMLKSSYTGCPGLSPATSTQFSPKTLTISYASCLGLSSGISSQFTPEMCVSVRNCEKFTKNPSFVGSRSFTVIDVDKSKKPVTSACYDKSHVCTYLQPFSH